MSGEEPKDDRKLVAHPISNYGHSTRFYLYEQCPFEQRPFDEAGAQIGSLPYLLSMQPTRKSNRADPRLCQNVVHDDSMNVRWAQMHTIRRPNLQHKRHRKLILINYHPSPFLHQALRHTVPICYLGVCAAFFSVGFGPWWEWYTAEPDFTGKA